MPNPRLQYLFDRYLAKTCTVQEKQELAEFILTSEYDEDVKALLQQVWEPTEGVEAMDEEKANQLFVSIIHATNPAPLTIERGARIRRIWRRFAAAAVLIAALAGGSYYLLNRENKQELAKTEPQEKRFKNDVPAPASNKAVLTLADGSSITLDSAKTGSIAMQGNMQVSKTSDGHLEYNGKTNGDAVQYNTLTVPKGSKPVQLSLADGTIVWLNVSSSITYPTAFVGKERKVTMTGEAYFEVKHNAAMPFKVSKGSVEIDDLGTSFNVNAYDDETEIKVTLLEGSVNVVNGTANKTIKPGEQAILRQAQDDKTIRIAKDVDVDEVMAWKNGVFKFKDATIETLMRQVEKWYAVDVNYEGKISSHFVATIPRRVSASNVFKILEATGGVHFKIEGNKITVMP